MTIEMNQHVPENISDRVAFGFVKILREDYAEYSNDNHDFANARPVIFSSPRAVWRLNQSDLIGSEMSIQSAEERLIKRTLPETPLLDKRAIVKLRTEFGKQLADELVSDFKVLTNEIASNIKASARKGDLDETTRFAHDLKSNAATLGLNRLADVALRIELACKSERLDKALAFHSELVSVLSQSLKALDQK